MANDLVSTGAAGATSGQSHSFLSSLLCFHLSERLLGEVEVVTSATQSVFWVLLRFVSCFTFHYILVPVISPKPDDY